jgi:nicotinamidase-related amidase
MGQTCIKPKRMIQREDSLLIIIDVQERLLPVIHEPEGIKQNVIRLAKFAGIIDLPVIITEQDKLGSTIPEVSAELEGATRFGKIAFDCFGQEGFASHLGLTGRGNLILAGIESHICVAQTALSALEHYNVHVVSDAMGSRTPLNHQVALNRLSREGVTVTSTEMVIYELLGCAGTDEFRAALKLVK